MRQYVLSDRHFVKTFMPEHLNHFEGKTKSEGSLRIPRYTGKQRRAGRRSVNCNKCL